MAFCGRASRAILRGNDKSVRIITRNGFENSFGHRGHQTFSGRQGHAAQPLTPHARQSEGKFSRWRRKSFSSHLCRMSSSSESKQGLSAGRSPSRKKAFDAPIRACSHSMSLVPSSSHSSCTQFSVPSRAERRQVTPCRVSSASGTKAETDSKTHLKLRALGFCFCPKRHCG